MTYHHELRRNLLLLVSTLMFCYGLVQCSNPGKSHKDKDSFLTDSPAIKSTASNKIVADSIYTDFDSLTQAVRLIIQNSKEKKALDLGRYCNTFGHPPTSIKKYEFNDSLIFIVVETNNVQLGFSSNAIYCIKTNRFTGTIYSNCFFEDIGVYDTSVSLSEDAEFYNYELNTDKQGRVVFTLTEYIPYKIKGKQYKTATKTCKF